MHVPERGEDHFEVGADVVGCECDKLASTPKHLPKEVVGVVGVGEADGEPDLVVVVEIPLEEEHGRRAPRAAEVAVALHEEELRKFPCAPPPRYRPHADLVLHDHARRVLALRGDPRETVGWAVVVHGGS